MPQSVKPQAAMRETTLGTALRSRRHAEEKVTESGEGGAGEDGSDDSSSDSSSEEEEGAEGNVRDREKSLMEVSREC